MTSETTSRAWVRETLAEFAVESDDETQSIGDLELAPFQVRAARRGIAIARRYAGVIVADAVGLGKTRVALAIVETLRRERRRRAGEVGPIQICVPARLREQWRRKLRAADIDAHRICSHTEMSREDLSVGPQEGRPPGVILVDEAHRFRNPSANRAEVLAELSAQAPVVMATATPVCNSIWDLYYLCSMFVAEHDLRPVVGCDLADAFERAETGEFDLTELVERFVIRRTVPPGEGAFGERPSLQLEMLRYEPGEREAWLWAHLESALRELSFEACSRRWPRELFVEYAMRRWESGPQALLETLERLAAYHRRWLEARRHGRSLDRAEFRELFAEPAAERQEVFGFLFPAAGDDETGGGDREAVRADLERLVELKDRTREVVGRHLGATSAIVDLAVSTDEKLLIFTRYRRAAAGIERALRDELGTRARVGLATGGRARATGLGRCSLDELLRRFAPQSYGGEALPAHQQLRVLVATDCLSEGVNLQDCGRVVLADLPYSALVVEQRVGRFVRPGSPHETVEVYLPRPDDWSDTLGLRRRLRHKFDQAEMSGAGFAAAGSIVEADRQGSPPVEDDARAMPGGGGGPASPGRPGDRETRKRAPGPARMATPTAPEEPLGALTKLDALARRLEANCSEGPAGGWHGRAPIREASLWLYAEQHHGGRVIPHWLLVSSDGSVAHRRSALVVALVALADADLPLRRGPLPDELLERGRSWLRAREARMRAVALAPVPLAIDAPQHRLWRRICAWSDSGEIEVPAGDLERLRERLLIPFPRGSRRQLRELLASEAPPSRVYREVERIVARFDAGTEPPEFEIVSGLVLRPRGP